MTQRALVTHHRGAADAQGLKTEREEKKDHDQG